MAKREHQDSDLKADLKSYLASRLVDDIADYVARGRRHSSFARARTRSRGVSGQLPPNGTTPPTPRRSPRTKRNLVTSAKNLASRRTGPTARPPHLR
jgi:hypothetical protein